MEQVFLSPIALDVLMNNIQQIIRTEINSKQKNDAEEQLLSPAQCCELFNPKISKVTLAKWTNQGLLPVHRLGGRVYYKHSEIMESLKTLKKYKAKSGACIEAKEQGGSCE